MIHKQWRVSIVLDVLAYEESTADRNVQLANKTLRQRLEGEGLAPGVNISEIKVTGQAPVPESGKRNQLDHGTKFCVVLVEDDECCHPGSVMGPFDTRQLALEALSANHPGDLAEDEFGLLRDRYDRAVAKVVTIETAGPTKTPGTTT